MALDSANIYTKYYDGIEWTDPINITEDSANDGFPKVAVDSTGNVWVVWQSDREGNEDIYATYFDGDSWLDSPLHIASGPSGDFTPRISMDRRGRVWFAWMSNFNIFTRFYDGDLSAVFQVTVGYFVHQNPRVIGDASSNIWVVWTKEEGDANIHARYYDGSSSPHWIPRPSSWGMIELPPLPWTGWTICGRSGNTRVMSSSDMRMYLLYHRRAVSNLQGESNFPNSNPPSTGIQPMSRLTSCTMSYNLTMKNLKMGKIIYTSLRTE